MKPVYPHIKIVYPAKAEHADPCRASIIFVRSECDEVDISGAISKVDMNFTAGDLPFVLLTSPLPVIAQGGYDADE